MRLRRTATCGMVLLLGFITPSTGGAAAPEEQFPKFQAKNLARKTPAFVPAEQIANVEDPVAAGLLEEGEKWSLDRYREGYRREAAKTGRPATAGTTLSNPRFSSIAEAECQSFTLTVDERFPKPHEKFSDLLGHSDSIFSGRIAAVTQGFLFGQPATLLKVEVLKELRQSPELPTTPYRYVYYPFAAFQIRGEPFCSRTPVSPHRPQAGERILVFNYFPTVDLEQRLVHTVRTGLFFEDAGGALVVPPPLKWDPALYLTSGFDALLQAVEQALSKSQVGELEDESRLLRQEVAG